MKQLREFDEAARQNNWNNLKTSVKTHLMLEKAGRHMSIDDLLLNINLVTFDSLVCQADVKTAEDQQAFAEKGYQIALTADAFRERFQIDPSCVWFSNSIYSESIYFNRDTFAAAPLHLELYISGVYSDTDKLYSFIASREEEARNQDYSGSLLSLPDGMRMEYFKLLIGQKGTDIPGLYELFCSNYVNSDYGFGTLDSDTLSALLHSKTDADRQRTTEKLAQLPDTFSVYRGGNSASTPYGKAYSWTLDINVANFFACRRGEHEGYLVEAEVRKQDVIEAFLDDRNEQEIIIAPENTRIIHETPLHGVEFLGEVLPQVAPMYQKYLERLLNLEFAQNSEDHGYSHEARVMLLSLIIAHKMDLPLRDREILATAALYHDLRRVNDIDDSQHGKDARDYYHATVSNPDPLVEFLCQYHCLPDAEGYQEIRDNRKLSKGRSRAKLLIDIFKDADALDRCRFGLRDLDVNQLRLPISKELPLAARLCYNSVRVPELSKHRKPSLSSKIASAASAAKTVQSSGAGKTQEPSLDR